MRNYSKYLSSYRPKLFTKRRNDILQFLVCNVVGNIAAAREGYRERQRLLAEAELFALEMIKQANLLCKRARPCDLVLDLNAERFLITDE